MSKDISTVIQCFDASVDDYVEVTIHFDYYVIPDSDYEHGKPASLGEVIYCDYYVEPFSFGGKKYYSIPPAAIRDMFPCYKNKAYEWYSGEQLYAMSDAELESALSKHLDIIFDRESAGIR